MQADAPGTHPRLERLRGRKAQLLAVFLSRSFTPRLRSRWAALDARGVLSLFLLKIGRVRKWTPRAWGGTNEPSAKGSDKPAQTSEGQCTPFLSALCRGQRSTSCWRDPHARLYPMGRPERRVCVGPAGTSHLPGVKTARVREVVSRCSSSVRPFIGFSNTLLRPCTLQLTRGCTTQYSWAGTKMQATEIVVEL